MSNTDALKTLCYAMWMPGRLSVESTSGKVILRKRHYPIYCAICCYGIMGGVSWFCIRLSPAGFGVVEVIYAFILATLFVAFAIYLDRKPPLLEYDLASLTLILPRSGIQLDSSSQVRLGIREVAFRFKRRMTTGEALYIAKDGEDEGMPIYVERGRGHLRSREDQFAAITHFPTFTMSRISVARRRKDNSR
jgi:hypothetical protein